MKICKHWARQSSEIVKDGKTWNLVAFGGSTESDTHAEEEAERSLQRVLKRVRTGEPLDSYLYSDRPVREELKQEFYSKSGELNAVITRNNYGSLVLNTTNCMFIDMDFMPPGCMTNFFGKKSSPDDDIISRITTIIATRPELGVRYYRTTKGFRLIVTSALYKPNSPEARELLTLFGSDPLYAKLCHVQDCFRARLTAKPWRIDLDAPPFRFPWIEAEREKAQRTWEETYDKKAVGRAVCRFVGEQGVSTVLPEIQKIIDIHDRFCLGEGALV